MFVRQNRQSEDITSDSVTLWCIALRWFISLTGKKCLSICDKNCLLHPATLLSLRRRQRDAAILTIKQTQTQLGIVRLVCVLFFWVWNGEVTSSAFVLFLCTVVFVSDVFQLSNNQSDVVSDVLTTLDRLKVNYKRLFHIQIMITTWTFLKSNVQSIRADT